MSAAEDGERNGAAQFILRLLASGLFVSYLPAALMGRRKCTGAGFMGSLLALALVPLLPENRAAYAVFLALFCAFAVWVSGAARFPGNIHDNPRIVIDEIAGMWLAAALLPRTPAALAAAFVLFRFFDSAKPFGIRRLENLKGGLGVVADDLAAGAAACLLTHPGLLLAPNNFRIDLQGLLKGF